MPPAAEDVGADPGAATDPPPDGRRLRSERSRAAIVSALLELIREGEVRPSAASVAARAGVTARTLFNQFGDMESLMAIAATAQQDRVLGLLPRYDEAVQAGSSLEERLSVLCDQLAVLLEDTMHVRWTAVTYAPILTPEPLLKQAIDEVRALLRCRVAEFLDEEIAVIGPVAAERLLDALDTVHDPMVWRLRRFQQGLDPEQARRTMADTTTALVLHALATSSEAAPTS